MAQIQTRFLNDQKLPLVIEPDTPNMSLDSLLSLIQKDRATFRQNLLKYGGLLFRGFPVKGPEDFIAIMDALSLGQYLDYIGGNSPRTKVKGKVYTSTEAPPAIKIHLHNELSCSHHYPRHICFYCEVPPQAGGETFIGNARTVLQDADQSLLTRFKEKGLKYISRYYHKSFIMDLVNKFQRGHKTWIEAFETDKKAEVEKKCEQNNIGFQWHKRDWLEISRLRPAVLEHPESHEPVWFNQVHLFDYNPRYIGWWRYIGMRLFYRKHTLVDEIRYADDTKIARKDIYKIHDLLDKHAIYFPWEKGDVLILDNILTMHGRAPFKGARRILTAMTA